MRKCLEPAIILQREREKKNMQQILQQEGIGYAPHVPISNTEILSNKFPASLDLKRSHHLWKTICNSLNIKIQ